MAGKKKKAAPRSSATAKHASALSEHSRVLRDHSAALAKATAANLKLVKAINENTAAIAARPKTSPFREKIRGRIAKAIFSTPGALGDTVKVSSQILGGPGAGDAMVSNINNEFWPHAKVIHLTFDEIKDMTFGDLVDLIIEMLKS
jgi:hypothetical protein